VSYGFADGVCGELAYSYRDMGKTKKDKTGSNTSSHYRGHHVSAGVRFDI
jgi:opacity protein-like surface antigen